MAGYYVHLNRKRMTERVRKDANLNPIAERVKMDPEAAVKGDRGRRCRSRKRVHDQGTTRSGNTANTQAFENTLGDSPLAEAD